MASKGSFKNYYFTSLSEDDDIADCNVARSLRKRNIDSFFEKPKKRKPKVKSSHVSRASGNGVSYVSTNIDDGSTATHLIKIEVYDMKRLKNVPPMEHWKHADVRVKYYVATEDDKHYQNAGELIYNITKDVASNAECSKYFIESDGKQ